MNLTEFDSDLKRKSLDVLRNIRQHRLPIEDLKMGEVLSNDSIEFEPEGGICFNLEVATYNADDDSDSGLLLKSIFVQLGLHKYFPVPNEDFDLDGNKWDTLNPKHNAEGRWELVDKLIEVLEKDLGYEV